MRTEALKAIHQQQIDYVNNSGITVEVVEIHGTVHIKGGDGLTIIFMQDGGGSAFIAEARHNWNTFEDITVSEAYELQAYKYADLDS
jgi:hypothetical protein